MAIFAGRLIEELELLRSELVSRGHTVHILPDGITDLHIFNSDAFKEQLNSFDLVYYRTGLGTVGRVLLGSLLDKLAIPFINPCLYTQPFCNNKTWQLKIAQDCGIQIPKTYLGRTDTYERISEVLGSPFIIKAAEGIQGRDVYLVKTSQELDEILVSNKKDLLFQQCIQNDGDYRVFVIGNEVHAVFKRTPEKGNFRANMSLGGTGEAVTDKELYAALSDIARTIVRHVDANLVGVDIIQDKETQELYFLEVNINPGWKGLDATLGMNTAAAIADYFEQRFTVNREDG